MISPWTGIAVVSAALGGLLSGLKLLAARHPLHPETSRKTVHILMGLVTLSFPWLFTDWWPVVLLALLSVALLGGTRLIRPLRERFGGVLNGVERSSLGEIWFPLAVAALFLLAGGNRLLYVIPLLTLTLADAVAALVGVRYGTVRYETSEGSKSLQGSAAFFAAAFLSAGLPLLAAGETATRESLLIALIIASVVMLFEAVSTGGFDNLFIPLGCYGLLRRYLPMGPEELLFRLGAIVLLTLLVFGWRRRTTLIDSGLLAAALVGYMNWALGGWRWMVVSLILFLTYGWTGGREEPCRRVQAVTAVAAVTAPGMLWLLAAVATGRDGFYYPFVISYAAQAAIIGSLRLADCRPERPAWQCLVGSVCRTWIIFLPTFLLPALTGAGDAAILAKTGLIEAAAAAPLLAAAVAASLRFGRRETSDTTTAGWLRQAVTAKGASLAGAAVLLAAGRL